MDTRTPAEVEDAEHRKAEVLRLKRLRYTFEEIGERLVPPVSRQRAHQIYAEALRDIPALEAAELRTEHRELLEDALRKAQELYDRDYVVVSHGKVIREGMPAIDPETGKAVIREGEGSPLFDAGPKLQALTRIQSLSESLRRLYGVDLPVRVDLGGDVSVQYTVVGVDMEALK
ncbi:hypothetical protein [Umezawaea tangerina]|uniref:Uncharacterized protein n=1 Tax=Umezawaea tangerina TaxID=84725 RepID=A0A2T0SPN9_9PSEU|nr:hypothetical protein [Umezawaea tangerina]PRY35377.1 hypothetical protein CLV43_114295 [Umezawaea tangerina]